jgi:hypothetical protein
MAAAFTAGMNNNNPGNIKYDPSIPWQGQVGPSTNKDQGDPQVVFNSQAAGMRAMARNIATKYNNGATTIQQLIAGAGGWTPGYQPGADGVAAAAGLPVNQPINMNDPSVLAQVMRGIVTQEHGSASNFYTDQMITDGISAATGHPVPPMNVPGSVPNAGANNASAYTGIDGSPALSAITDALAPTAGQNHGVPLARQQPFNIPAFNPFTAGDALAFDPATINGGALPGQMDAGYNATTGQMQPYDTANTRAATASSTPAATSNNSAWGDLINALRATASSTPAATSNNSAWGDLINALRATNTSGSPDDRNSAAPTFTGNTQAGVEQLPAGWHPAPGIVPSLDSVPTPVSHGAAPYGGPFNSMDAAAGNTGAPYGGPFNSIDATAGNNASWDALVKSFTSQIGGTSNANTGGTDYSAAGTINNNKDQSQLPAGSPLAFDPNATGAPNYTTIPGSGTPTIMSQQLNPAYTAWMNNQQPSGGIDAAGNGMSVSGSATGAVGINGLATGALAMPQKYIRVPMANPNYVAPRQQLTVAPATVSANPPAMAGWQLHPLANGYTYAANPNGGYVNIGQTNAALTPAQVYDAANQGQSSTGNNNNPTQSLTQTNW